MENQKSLKTGALVSQLPDPVKDQVHDLLSDGVMASGIVVCGVLLASDELLGVEELPVDASPHLVNDGGFQVYEDSAGYVFTRASFLGDRKV